jgi:PBP1b-binding outer membrane lipoprotein LpoB
MDRRQYLGLTGTSIAALLSGCSSSGDQSTAPATDTATGTPTATSTDTPTATDTATQTETATETPESQNRSFQGVYDDVMEEADAPSVPDEMFDQERSNPVNTEDWSARDLERVAVAAAQNARKEHSAQNIAKTLYQTFSSDVDELYADSRRVSLGGGRDILKVFDQKNDGILYLVPWASQTGEDDALRPEEKPNTNTERNLAGLQDPQDTANYDSLDPQSTKNRFESWKEQRKEEGKQVTEELIGQGWVNMIGAYADLLPGAEYKDANITVTEEAGNEIGDLELIRPEDPNEEDPNYEGIDHIERIVEEYEAANLDSGEWLKVHYEDNQFQFTTTNDYNPSQGFAEAP